ncbi:hypothetical protein KM043_002950 [Ampulex compressa]|nr:hypothetical protein KM043_002950 [Ampulex compressa]
MTKEGEGREGRGGARGPPPLRDEKRGVVVSNQKLPRHDKKELAPLSRGSEARRRTCSRSCTNGNPSRRLISPRKGERKPRSSRDFCESASITECGGCTVE